MSDDLGILEDRHRHVSLRYHARARRAYYGSGRAWATLNSAWDEDDDIPLMLARIAGCGYVEQGEAVPPASEDSWEHFARCHGEGIFNPDVSGYAAGGGKLGLAAPVTRSAVAQVQWEAEEARRREAAQAESDRQWLAEVERRRRAEVAERRARAKAVLLAERVAREAAEFLVSWVEEPARRILAATLALERTAAGELTPVSWQTEGLYRVEGARRVLRNSNRIE